MQICRLSLTAILTLALSLPTLATAANRAARTCNTANISILEQNSIAPGGIGGTGHDTAIPPGGIGGTGHEPQTAPDNNTSSAEHNVNMQLSDNSGIAGTGHEISTPAGGIGGTGHETTASPGGIGGTGHETAIPPGGIGGTGIVAAGSLVNVNGMVTVLDQNKQTLQLASGDEICVGDKITTAQNAKAKIEFTDGAVLYVLKNSEISLIDYNYSIKQPELSRNSINLARGDIRSVSGKISKINPQQYSFSTPVSTIRVVGTDFLITHLPEQEGALDAGTYTKVISGEIDVLSSSGSVRLHAGESSHVMLNGTQSITSGGGGTCMAAP